MVHNIYYLSVAVKYDNDQVPVSRPTTFPMSHSLVSCLPATRTLLLLDLISRDISHGLSPEKGFRLIQGLAK
jgi:hypothetical protein